MNEEKQVYELSYLILPSIAEGELNGVVEKIKAIVAKAGGNQLDGEEPFKYPLAYEMSKTIGASNYVVNDAYIGWMKFELDPLKALDVKSEVEQITEVLRSLLIKAPKETHFTFASARAKLIAEEEEKRAPEEEPAPVAEVVE